MRVKLPDWLDAAGQGRTDATSDIRAGHPGSVRGCTAPPLSELDEAVAFNKMEGFGFGDCGMGSNGMK
jgi:hypothetical protein